MQFCIFARALVHVEDTVRVTVEAIKVAKEP
jgi:hypothetical protein